MTTDDNTNTIERAFQLLEEAKKFESSKDYWNATTKFVEAHEVLHHLAVTSPRLTDDELRTVELFERKATEYFHKSRQSFIEALKQEKVDDETKDTEQEKTSGSDGVSGPGEEGDDKKDGADSAADDNNGDGLSSLIPVAPDVPPSRSLKNKSFIYSNIDDHEAKSRIETFTTLFSKPAPLTFSMSNDDNNINGADGHLGSPKGQDDEPQSLEERLAALNKSLPSTYKTADERLNEINRSMNKLGLSVFPQSKPFERVLRHEPEKSEDEQIDEIMAMAQDEANLAKHQQQQEAQQTNGNGTRSTTATDDDDNDSDDDDDDEEEGDELILDDDQLAIKKIRRRIVKAQLKMSKLVALLDQAGTSLTEEDIEEQEKILRGNDGDDDSIDSIPKVPAEFFLTSGKKQLQDAQKDLRKAMKCWTDELDK